MAAERTETKTGSIIKLGPNLRKFIEDAQNKANINGKDPDVAAFEALFKARETGKIDDLIDLDIKNVPDSSTSRK